LAKKSLAYFCYSAIDKDKKSFMTLTRSGSSKNIEKEFKKNIQDLAWGAVATKT